MNDSGNKVRVIDSGHDSMCPMWIIWNTIGSYNEGHPIWYEVDDCWLNDYIPALLPLEGTVAKMSTKVMCKGKTYSLAGLIQMHINANGDITTEVRKYLFE